MVGAVSDIASLQKQLLRGISLRQRLLGELHVTQEREHALRAIIEEAVANGDHSPLLIDLVTALRRYPL